MTRKWAIGGALAVGAAALLFLSVAPCVFPGESARLLVKWGGLAPAPVERYPLLAFVYRLFGGAALFSPLCALAATVSLAILVAAFCRRRLAGLVAGVVFLLSPAVREAASHLEPRMFSVAWLFGSSLLLVAMARAPARIVRLLQVALGALIGLGCVDAPQNALALPFLACAVVRLARARGGCGRAAAAAFVGSAVFAFGAVATLATGDAVGYRSAAWASLAACWRVGGWLFVAAFAALPFFAAAFANVRSVRDANGLSGAFFHVSLSLASLFAIASPLAPSAVMARHGILPVLPCAYAAALAGYLTVWWEGAARAACGVRRTLAFAALAVLTAAWGSALGKAAWSFDPMRGAFADLAAERLLDGLGSRRWLVTDARLDVIACREAGAEFAEAGRLRFDDHLRLAAKRRGQNVTILPISGEWTVADDAAFKGLAARRGLGCEAAEALALACVLGKGPFVSDWFALDPAVTSLVAVVGTGDFWREAGCECVPEELFFGADAGRFPSGCPPSDARLEAALLAPRPWGSGSLESCADPVERFRLGLRRHFGRMANERGVWLQDAGCDDEAFRLYERVLDEIDGDNVSALFNAHEQAEAGVPAAVARAEEFKRRLARLAEDPACRFRLEPLVECYGAIRTLRTEEDRAARLAVGSGEATGAADAAALKLLLAETAVALRRLGEARDPATRRAALRELEARREKLVATVLRAPAAAAAQELLLAVDLALGDLERAERHARRWLVLDRRAPLANYALGASEAAKGELALAEGFLRRAVEGPMPVVPALNDLADVLRRRGRLEEAEAFAVRATERPSAPAVGWLTLAQVRLARGDRAGAEEALRALAPRADELAREAQSEYEELLRNVR